MKTQEVERKNLVIGGEYYDQPTNGKKFIYVGTFTSDDMDECIFFYAMEDTWYEEDLDGTIPFCLEGSPFYEQVND